MRATRAVHQPLQANLIVEPASAKVVPLLEALPATESLFYKEEANVVELLGKSAVIFDELQTRFGFIGGSEVEYHD